MRENCPSVVKSTVAAESATYAACNDIPHGLEVSVTPTYRVFPRGSSVILTEKAELEKVVMSLVPVPVGTRTRAPKVNWF